MEEHIPVLLNEVIEGLDIKPDGVYLDMYSNNYKYDDGYSTAMNDGAQVRLTLWAAKDAGSAFVITPIDDMLSDLKTQYSALVDGCETLTALFSSSDCATAKTAITNATTGLEVISAYETLIATANNQLITLKSHDAQKYISFGNGIKATDSEGILKVVSKHDLVAFQNPETGKYISCPFSQSSQFLASDTPDYFHFVFNSGSYSGYVCLASSNARTSSGTLTMHDANNGSGNIVTWYSNAANSFFLPASKTLADFKTSIKSKLDAISGWQPIYSSSDIATAKGAVDEATTVDEVNTIYENAIKAADGKLLSVENYSNAGRYMSINATNVTTRTYPTVIKLVVNSDLTYSLQGYLNFDGYYAEQLKNVNYTFVASSATAGKYRIGYSDTKGFLFYSTEHSGCLHYSNANIVRWYDDADASYWTVSDVADAAYLGSYYNALLPYQDNYGQYGYYKSGNTTKAQFDDAMTGIETILGDLSGQASSISTGKTIAKGIYDSFTPVVPQAGDFLRIKASDGNKTTGYGLGASNLYLTSSNCASKTDRAGFAEGATATDNTTIFYYNGTNLTGFANGLQAKMNGSNMMQIGSVGDSPTVVGFEEIYGTEDHAYRIEFNNGGRSLYTQRGGSEGSYYYHTDAAGANATDAHYRYFLEKVTVLPITMNAVDSKYYGTINLPVAVTIPEGVYAYKAAVAGDVMTLTKVVENGVLAANTPVVLYSASEVTSLAISAEAGTGADDDAFSGTTAAITAPEGTNYVLNYSPTEGVGFYKYTGSVIPGFKAYFNDPSGSSVKGFSFSMEDVETAIRAIESENNDLEIYDIAGRRVPQAQKGLYIVNGKKVMFK